MRIAAAVMFAALLAAAALARTQAASGDQPRIHRLDGDRVQVGAAVVDAHLRTVTVAGRVNMQEGGPIELLACLPSGKVHESVFVLDVLPMDLQLALLLLDLHEGRNPAVHYQSDDPERLEEPAAMVRIGVEWHDPAASLDSALLRAPAERFLYSLSADTGVATAQWAFLGSMNYEGRFGADLEGSLITTYHDPLAVLELVDPAVNDNAYRANVGYNVNKSLCPPVGTPVTLTITAETSPCVAPPSQ